MSVNKMYDIVYAMPGAVVNLESMLNEKAALGYRPIYFWDMGTKLVVVLEFHAKGRPRKEDEDNHLGE